MTLDPATGVWSVTGPSSWYGKYYLYEVKVFVRSTGHVETNLVTDPYSVSLSMNSKRSQIVSLDDPAFKPPGWDGLAKPRLAAPEDIVLYELHVRDFSANDASVPANLRGTFKAFTHKLQRHEAPARAGPRRPDARPPAAGVRHRLHQRGQVDLADPGRQPVVLRARLRPSSRRWCRPWPNATASTGATTRCTTPCPRAATPPTPTARRASSSSAQMVQSLNQSGLRVVMDVVYNHTTAAGQNDHSVLDSIVPGYYHRLERRRQRHNQLLLPGHGHRAHHDGEAHDRLGGDLGEAATRSTASASTSWAST